MYLYREEGKSVRIFKQSGAGLEQHRSAPLTSCVDLPECARLACMSVLQLDLKAVTSNTNVGFMRLYEENDQMLLSCKV